MDMKKEESLGLEYFTPFDLFIHPQPVDIQSGFENLQVSDEFRHYLKYVHSSTMIATNEVGVVIGESAETYAAQQSMNAGLEQELLQPLYERAYFPIQAPGDLLTIDRKIGEVRGMYFAKILNATLEKDSEDVAKELFGVLAFQLLLDHKRVTEDGREYIIPFLAKNDAIEAELSLLDKIIESGEHTSLSETELIALSSLLELARTYHKDLKEMALTANVQSVKNEHADRRKNLLKNRVIKRIAALACASASIISLSFIPSSNETTNTSTESVINDTESLDALLIVNSKLNGNNKFDPLAQEIITDVISDSENRIGNEKLTNDDRSFNRRVVKMAEKISTYFNQQSPDITENELLEMKAELLDIQTEIIESNTISDSKAQRTTDYIGIGFLVSVFTIFGGALLRSTSKDGGKKDPLIKDVLPVVKNGQVPKTYIWQGPSSLAIKSYNQANKDRNIFI